MPPHIRPQSTVDIGLLLSDAGVLDRQNAQICGVAIKTVRRWRRLYQRRGVVRGGTPPMPPCFICHEGSLDVGAYGYLLGLCLGDGHIVRNKRGVYVLSIFQDNAYRGLIEECRTVIEAVKPRARPHLSAKPGCTAVQAYSTHWPCLFPQHGPGVKSKRPIILEDWQRELIAAEPRPFLRGLLNSDGCRITNWTVRPVAGQPKRYEYPRYFFSNRSEDILGLCTWALDLLDISWRRSNAWNISVAQRAAVAALDEFIGPKY
jgi:hypothetical protein